MKESYVEGLAAHDGPESCVGARKGGGEAGRGQGRVETTNARPRPGGGPVAPVGVGRSLPLLRSPDEQPGVGCVPFPARSALASRDVSTQPAWAGPLGSDVPPDCSLPASCSHLSCLSFASSRRHHLRQEPDAVIPLVRICGGCAPSRGVPTPTVPFQRKVAHSRLRRALDSNRIIVASGLQRQPEEGLRRARQAQSLRASRAQWPTPSGSDRRQRNYKRDISRLETSHTGRMLTLRSRHPTAAIFSLTGGCSQGALVAYVLRKPECVPMNYDCL